jgi:hypothetical protein
MARAYVDIKPEMLTWAITRASFSVYSYLDKNPQVKTYPLLHIIKNYNYDRM